MGSKSKHIPADQRRNFGTTRIAISQQDRNTLRQLALEGWTQYALLQKGIESVLANPAQTREPRKP